ncbi:hypothetical protein LUW77_24285 [Streptomyces radiopugnans]|nr:hypothetical protein LUW77_24285 [Streptomyces radiopugnans]
MFGHARRLLAGLRSLGWDTGDSTTPVVPVYVGDSRLCLRVWQELLDAGVFTNAVVALSRGPQPGADPGDPPGGPHRRPHQPRTGRLRPGTARAGPAPAAPGVPGRPEAVVA